jgi:hypothetical protein
LTLSHPWTIFMDMENNDFDLMAFLNREVPIDPAVRRPERSDSRAFPESDERFARRIASYERYMQVGEI